MPNQEKYERILDSLQQLLESRDITSISVQEIAQNAGIGKGSVYYYFPSKEAILEALVARSYEKPIQVAQSLAQQKEISPFTRMAMIFQACRNASSEFLRREATTFIAVQEKAYLHQKYLSHIIAKLKPVLAEIIRQGIERGDIHFQDPVSLADIVLIVLTVKMDNTLSPSTPEEIGRTVESLVSLLEKGTENPAGSLNFLTALT